MKSIIAILFVFSFMSPVNAEKIEDSALRYFFIHRTGLVMVGLEISASKDSLPDSESFEHLALIQCIKHSETVIMNLLTSYQKVFSDIADDRIRAIVGKKPSKKSFGYDCSMFKNNIVSLQSICNTLQDNFVTSTNSVIAVGAAEVLEMILKAQEDSIESIPNSNCRSEIIEALKEYEGYTGF